MLNSRPQSAARNFLFAVVFLFLISAGFVSIGTNATAQDFDKAIAPLIADNCLECHSGKSPEGGLDLASSESAFNGGDSGRALVPGNINDSLFWERIESDEMPPKHPLSAAEKKLVRRWIEGGAKWGTSPIDRFLRINRPRI